jgi:hypothetical protein
MTICRHLEDIGGLRDDVDARLASRSNEWLLAHASAAILRSPAEPLSPN